MGKSRAGEEVGLGKRWVKMEGEGRVVRRWRKRKRRKQLGGGEKEEGGEGEDD